MRENSITTTMSALEEAIKIRCKKILERGEVSTPEEWRLVSAVAFLWKFWRKGKSDQEDLKEFTSLIRELWEEIGFFFPPITGVIFRWIRKGEVNVLRRATQISYTFSGKLKAYEKLSNI